MDLFVDEPIPYIVRKTKKIITKRELKNIYNSIVKGDNFEEFEEWLLDNDIIGYAL